MITEDILQHVMLSLLGDVFQDPDVDGLPSNIGNEPCPYYVQISSKNRGAEECDGIESISTLLLSQHKSGNVSTVERFSDDDILQY